MTFDYTTYKLRFEVSKVIHGKKANDRNPENERRVPRALQIKIIKKNFKSFWSSLSFIKYSAMGLS